MWTRVRLRTKLAVPVGGPFAMAVRCMAASGYVLVVRAVNGDGEMFSWLIKGCILKRGGIELGTSEAF